MEEKKEKKYTLLFTEKELKNSQIKRAMADLIRLKGSLVAESECLEVSEAEVELLNMVPLFTPIKSYGEGKYPTEVGKLRSRRVILRK